MHEVFKTRSDDVIVASSLKSGTTWLKALTFTIMHRDKYTFSSHPLLKLNPHDCVPILEHHYGTRDEKYLEMLPSPRVLGTHLPYSMLPDSIQTSNCPIVYICREPKDVFVSFFHMVTKFEWMDKPSSFTESFELFCKGQVPYGPVWEHVLEFYTKSLCSSEKVLLLRYEEMLKDPMNSVLRIANFMGCPFTEEEMKNGLVERIVEFCSFNKLKNLDVNEKRVGDVLNNSALFRKAAVGDWQNYMTTEMANKLDEITKKKLCASSFSY
ncbi:Sulfotransferase [Rhynchospora pubera]|uniref:Sulfotransferase n=1 Tax=Rhynchospora pubera TaxID=906938 RepID=A0AAV8BNW1_9POAL|nr:Sulfotransferase [Rhynchospora pubera]